MSEPFATAAQRLDAAEFAAEFPHSYLCFAAGPLLSEEGEDGLPPTARHNLDETHEAPLPTLENPAKLHVVPILKREGVNPFPRKITFGRGRNNDVRIPYSDVSKLHGYFSRDGEGWVITDAGSTNGTFLAGDRLSPRTAAPLAFGTVLVIGSVESRVLQGAALHEFLQPQTS
ncbi:MAG: FHA domain-containing protein [Planctomycetes bacterium]|nr:FHA domain-containing protein [Planctomycetota bacterium]